MGELLGVLHLTSQEGPCANRHLGGSDRLVEDIDGCQPALAQGAPGRFMRDHERRYATAAHQRDLVREDVAYRPQLALVAIALDRQTRAGIAATIGEGGKM